MPPKAKVVDAAVEQDAARKAETYETVQRAMLISQIEAACASRAKHIAKRSELEKKVTDITQGHGDVSAFLQKKLAKNYEQIGALEVSQHCILHCTQKHP
jgi:D-ribose pyranose/furanose isomerase RbsD